MKTLLLDGKVDENHQLRAVAPDSIPAGSVRLVLLVPEDQDEEFSDAWMKGIAREWAAELGDPREDIYTLEDGEPIDGPR